MTKEKKVDLTPRFYRVVYILFILLALYQLVAREDFIDAASSMAIALIFDPFNQATPWGQRPVWQRAWLIVHLGVAAGLFGYGVAVG